MARWDDAKIAVAEVIIGCAECSLRTCTGAGALTGRPR